MSRLHIGTRGVADWRQRLARPECHWKRGYSAFETAVSSEIAARTARGLPEPIVRALSNTPVADAVLLLGVAEHKVALRGRGYDSQCDVWALLTSAAGQVSLTVEAKANESFGKLHEPLAT